MQSRHRMDIIIYILCIVILASTTARASPRFSTSINASNHHYHRNYPYNRDEERGIRRRRFETPMSQLSRFFASIGVVHSKSTFISVASVGGVCHQMLPASRKRPACSMTTNCNDETKAISSSQHHLQRQLTYRPLVIVLAGPTAVGKSDVAALLCSETFASRISRGHRLANTNNNAQCQKHHAVLRGNVISADSVQVYRDANIGSNKPNEQEMEITPHHPINIIDIDVAGTYNAAYWTDDACYVIQNLAPPLEVDDANNQSDNVTACEDEGGDNNIDDNDNDNDKFSAVQMRRECINKALEQHSTAKPVVVGGTMMYLQWLVHGRPMQSDQQSMPSSVIQPRRLATHTVTMKLMMSTT